MDTNTSEADRKLISAAINANAEGVRDALAKGANPDATGGICRQTAFEIAYWMHENAQGETREIMKILAEHPKMDPNRKNGHGETPLYLAVMSNLTDIARVLVERGANPDAPITIAGFAKINLLTLAIRAGNREMLDLLQNKPRSASPLPAPQPKPPGM